MKSIKFRVWDEARKELSPVEAIDWSNGQIVSVHTPNRKLYGDKFVLEQFTGEHKTIGFVAIRIKGEHRLDLGDIKKTVRIIGNIHENPELLVNMGRK